MNKKIFSFGLFREGIKQLRVVGILAFVILGLEAILIPVGKVISIITSENLIERDLIVRTVDAFSAHPLLVAMFVVFAPIMTLILFGFLNKRNTSDFYHALPHTRLCIYISFMCSIVAWVGFIILGTTLLSVITHLIFFKFFTLIYSSLFMLALNCFIASLLVVASVAIAMTLSGTTFTNVILSGLIIFLPRFVISIMSSSILSLLPMVPSGHLFPLLSNEYNAVTGTVFGLFTQIFYMGGGYIDIVSLLTGGAALVYTAVLAFIYFVIAALLFYRRQSESASRSAPNRFLQAVYRITVTMTICSLIIAIMFGERNSSYQETFGYVVLYIIALVIYFTYEIITTKKWKNLLRAIPALGIVAVLNVGLYAGMFGIYSSQLNYTPSADKIKSVTLVSGSELSRYWDIPFASYVQYHNSSIEIKDREVIEIVADSLADCVDTYKEMPRRYHHMYTQYHQQDVGNGSRVSYQAHTFKIETGSGVKYRTIYIPADKTVKIAQALESHENYKEIWMTLPSEISNTVYITSYRAYISGAEAHKVYAKMKEELKTIDFADWYQAINSQDGSDMYSRQDVSMYVQTRIGARTYTVSIPIYPSLMPESYALYAKALNEQQKDDIVKLKEKLTTDNNKNTEINAELFIYDEGKERYVHFAAYITMDAIDGKTLANFLLEHIADEPISINGNYAYIEVYDRVRESDGYGEDYYNYTGTGYFVMVALDDISQDEIPSFMGSYEYEEKYIYD